MFIKSIHLKNILSFGEDIPVLELQDLNILIGANGSGKSNLVDVIEVLPNRKGKFTNFINKTGGVKNWVHKKNENYNNKLAYIQFNFIDVFDNFKLEVIFNSEAENFTLSTKRIAIFPLTTPENKIKVGHINYIHSKNENDYSYGEVNEFLSENISIFRDWTFGRYTLMRNPQESDAPKEFLKSDFSNLNLVLSEICSYPKSQEKLLKALKKMNEDFDDLRFAHPSGWIELFLFEGEKRISAKRLSDGTLRYLCLLAILCHPNPPPLICIEEPELGFHPDLLPTIAELLKDASTRTQLIVTTHSDILIDCFSDKPEAVIVFDKVDGATTMTRLSRDDLKHWMDEKFSLGKHWLSGQIGGLRW